MPYYTKKMIDVSCIIINYNTSKYTFEAVASILKTHVNTISLEIIVVDNASHNEDYLQLKTSIEALKADNVCLVRSNINTGFGTGNMTGVKHASPCKYFAFINNDTLQVSTNALGQLMQFMDNNKSVGICSPQMLDENKNFRVTIDHFSSIQREILKRKVLETIWPKTYLNRKIEYKKPTKVHYVQGSFMFVDAIVFNELGGFDTNLFLYYEESDLSLRFLRKKQKSTYLIPSVNYIHYNGISTTRNIDIKIEQKISLLYYIKKHFGWFHHQILLKWFIIRYFFTSIIKPKYWKVFYVLLIGAPLSKSLKQKQSIKTLDAN